MGRKRKTNSGLPEGIYLKHGAYHYRDPITKKWKKIGNDFQEMIINYLKISRYNERIYRNMNDVFERYMLEVAPLKAALTYKKDLKQVEFLKKGFGHVPPELITPTLIYQYMDERGKVSKVGANREKSLLSHVFSMAIRWGIIEINPCREVRRFTEKPRTRYITDEEFLSVRSLAAPIMQYIMDFAFITGLRKSDILKIKISDLTENGIITIHNKTKKRYLIEWNDDLITLISKIRQLERSKLSLFLFCTIDGDPYTVDGFGSLWKRLRTKALEKGLITESFRFHDIRRKTATEAENLHGREFARKLLGHSTQQMTERYISGIRPVAPLRNLSNLQ